MSAQKIWDHVITMISFLMLLMMLVMMLVGSPSLADPVPAAQDPSISAAGIGLSDPRIKRSPDWEIGVPNFSWLVNFGATEMPATTENLLRAAEEGNLEDVKDLIARGVDVNFGYGVTLTAAAEHGHLEVVKYLLEAGAHPDGAEENRSFKGWVLKNAAKNNHLDIVNVLLDAGATVKTEKHGVAVLDGAVENGHLEVVQRLLEAGADPDHGNGYTLLLAAKGGHLDVVNALIEADADVNAGKGWIIGTAAGEGQLEIVKALIERGVTSKDYGNAMTSAAENGHLDIVKLMLEKGADPSYDHVLKSAAEFGDLEVVRTLLEAGSNITYDDVDGSPLHYAAIKGHPEVVALLVEYGADINRPLAKDFWWDLFTDNTKTYGNGWTVMHVAARWGQTMIEKLVALGADINMQDVKGRTPLHVALEYKKVITAKEMLRFCADLTPTNDEGKTALDLAKAIASENERNSSKLRDLMNILTEALPEKLASSPYNEETVLALRKEFQTMIEANSTLKDTYSSDIYGAIQYIFEERGRQAVTKIIEDHNCKMSLLEKGTIAMGTEYLARCECVPGQGPKMTFIPVIQDGNLCGQRATVQEE